MDHAEVRAWLEDAFFLPGLLRRVGTDPSETAGDGIDVSAEPGLTRVNQHLETCPDCAAYAISLRRTGFGLDMALGPSPAAKDRTLEAVRSVGRKRDRPEPAPARPLWTRLGSLRLAAAMVAVAVLGAAVGAALATAARPDGTGSERLARAVSVMSELAREPDAAQIVMNDSAGEAAGVAFVSGPDGRLAIFTASRGAADDAYWCYLQRGSEMIELGPMHVVDDVAFWAGPIQEIPNLGQATDRLLVALDEDAEPLFSGEFGQNL